MERSVLTGEPLPLEKSTGPVASGAPLAGLCSCALMGTVVRAGSGTGVVVATGGAAEFGRIAAGLEGRQPETEFQAGLRKFPMLLVKMAGVLTGAIFIINVSLHKPVIDTLLFSLSIAVGISPQLLPAVVSNSLAAGSRQLARSKVLVKRLVCIEDLGDLDVLFTDKTGTLTEGSLRFMRSAGQAGQPMSGRCCWGCYATRRWSKTARRPAGIPLTSRCVIPRPPPGSGRRWHAVGGLTFCRSITNAVRHRVLVEDDRGNRVIITKGAPEGVLDRCADIPGTARRMLGAEFSAGNQVIAVATREAPGLSSITPADEHGLAFRGTLVFLDPPNRPPAER